MPPLLSLLNGANDKPFPFANEEESKEFQQVLFEINSMLLLSVNRMIVLKTLKKTNLYSQ